MLDEFVNKLYTLYHGLYDIIYSTLDSNSTNYPNQSYGSDLNNIVYNRSKYEYWVNEAFKYDRTGDYRGYGLPLTSGDQQLELGKRAFIDDIRASFSKRFPMDG